MPQPIQPRTWSPTVEDAKLECLQRSLQLLRKVLLDEYPRPLFIGVDRVPFKPVLVRAKPLLATCLQEIPLLVCAPRPAARMYTLPPNTTQSGTQKRGLRVDDVVAGRQETVELIKPKGA
eukprot:727192-Amphidinium_carterae.1